MNLLFALKQPWAGLLTALVVCILFGLLLIWNGYRTLFYARGRTPFRRDHSESRREGERAEQVKRAYLTLQNFRQATLTAAVDHLIVQGVFYQDRPDPKALAVVVHGWNSEGAELSAHALALLQEGFAVFVPDLRGRGASEGSRVTMAVKETEDVKSLLQSLYHNNVMPETAPLILFGVSMGAATVLRLGADPDMPVAPTAVIADCGYTSIRDESTAVLGRLPDFILRMLFWGVTFLAEHRLGFKPLDPKYSPLAATEKRRTPTLIIHGGEDTFVPTEMGYRLAAAAGTEPVIIPGAKHAEAYFIDPTTYMTAIRDFLAQRL